MGGNGVITGITITNPGTGYVAGSTTVQIQSASGTGAAATPTVTGSGAIVDVTVNTPGSGYKAPVATISGGGATTDATATAYGSVAW